MTDYRVLLAGSDEQLARVDPLVMNLLVAKGIPALADLDIPRYQRRADAMTDAFRAWLATTEPEFLKDLSEWENDINFARLAALCQFLDQGVGIAYKEEQREVTSIRYTDPSDLFVNGVMDTRRGTCGNLAELYLILSWRLGWPVSLACLKSHSFCRYDDGKVTYNIETSHIGLGGFSIRSDESYLEKQHLPAVAISCGSDMRALTPRETLGTFIGARARHLRDTGNTAEAELDYLLARWLFPNSRRLYIDALGVAVRRGERLFEPGEVGSPLSLGEFLLTQFGRNPVPPYTWDTRRNVVLNSLD